MNLFMISFMYTLAVVCGECVYIIALKIELVGFNPRIAVNFKFHPRGFANFKLT